MHINLQLQTSDFVDTGAIAVITGQIYIYKARRLQL